VRENVHSRCVEIAEPRFVGLLLARDEVLRAARNSSSIVSMRLVSSGPVLTMVCLPTRPKAGSTVVSFRFQAAPADPENHNYSLDNQFVGVIMRPSQPRTQIIISKLFATKCRF
jgi:hypothetical protein